MLVYLGRVSRRKREEADAMLVEVCSTLRQLTGIKKTEGALSRFERGETVPNYLDEVMEAYAEVTGTPAADFWAEALVLARSEGREVTEHDESSVALPGPLPGVSEPQTTSPAHDEDESGGEGSGRETG